LTSTFTATLAGQIILEGFLHVRLPAWSRRLMTRTVAIVPAILATLAYGESGTVALLVFSQVVLSMQLPFALVPLMRFVSSRALLGEHAAPRPLAIAAWLCTGLVIFLNIAMLMLVLPSH
jgi:manganese transport protein